MNTATTTKLYAYDGEAGSDPHAVILELSDEDVAAVAKVQAKERVGRYDFGTYVPVIDQATGERWVVASAPCGAACHCAAVAVRTDA